MRNSCMEKQTNKKVGNVGNVNHFVNQVVDVFYYKSGYSTDKQNKVKSTLLYSASLLNQVKDMIYLSKTSLKYPFNQLTKEPYAEDRIKINVKNFLDYCNSDYRDDLMKKWNEEKKVAYVKWINSKFEEIENYDEEKQAPNDYYKSFFPFEFLITGKENSSNYHSDGRLKLIKEAIEMTKTFIEEQKMIKDYKPLDDNLLVKCINGVSIYASHVDEDIDEHRSSRINANTLYYMLFMGFSLAKDGIIKGTKDNLQNLERSKFIVKKISHRFGSRYICEYQKLESAIRDSVKPK